MTPEVLATLTALGFALAVFSAIGARVLQRFPRHELEEHCRHVGRPAVFDRIMSGYEQFTLAAESLQVVSTVLTILAGSWWLWGDFRPSDAGAWSRFLGAGIVGVFALLVSTSWVPWAVVRLWAVPFLFHTHRIWWIASLVAWPLTVGLEFVVGVFSRFTESPHEPVDEEEALEDEIMSIVAAGEREGLLEPAAREMIEGVIELDDVTVGEIMTPRSRVDAISVDESWGKVIDYLATTQRSRYPVYAGSLDHIVGLLMVRDLLPHLRDGAPPADLRSILRQPIVVPDSRLADEMLREFLQTRQHLAVVLDEYESVAGIITIEDVLEEIVGEIRDESEPTLPPEVTMVAPNVAEVPGGLHLADLADLLALRLPDSDEYDTVGGLLMATARDVPQVDFRLEHAGALFRVLERSPRQVVRVRVEKRRDSDDDSEDEAGAAAATGEVAATAPASDDSARQAFPAGHGDAAHGEGSAFGDGSGFGDDGESSGGSVSSVARRT
ncbi:MAG TPA: hemolysin family protein [Pirellulaceae bacterium]|nr:hemolysin family protein [Pirellulaceae bacterium]